MEWLNDNAHFSSQEKSNEKTLLCKIPDNGRLQYCDSSTGTHEKCSNEELWRGNLRRQVLSQIRVDVLHTKWRSPKWPPHAIPFPQNNQVYPLKFLKLHLKFKAKANSLEVLQPSLSTPDTIFKSHLIPSAFVKGRSHCENLKSIWIHTPVFSMCKKKTQFNHHIHFTSYF